MVRNAGCACSRNTWKFTPNFFLIDESINQMYLKRLTGVKNIQIDYSIVGQEDLNFLMADELF